jgi:hypothetical protein
MAKHKSPAPAAASGQFDAILAGAASGPPAKVMEITLKLSADSGNAAVLKQLSEQVKDATHKAIQEVEHLGQALVKKAHGWAKDVGETLSKAIEKASKEREKAEAKEAAEPAHASAEREPAGREMPAHPEVSQPKSPADSKEGGPSHEQASENKSEKKPAEEKESTLEKLSTIGEKAKSAYEHLKEARSPDNDAMKRVGETFQGGKDAYASGKKAWEVLGTLKEVATGGKPVAEVGVTGMVANLGKAGLASLGGGSGIAAAAQIAGIGTVAVAGGVALHDGVKLLLNKVGFLGGNFDTLSGTVLEWNESTKRSVEIEKKIAETQEAHQQQLEQIQRNQQNVRSVYEARDRIEESRKSQKEVGDMVAVGAHYARRFNAVDAEHVGTERELQERDKQHAATDRAFATEQYAKKFKEKELEQTEAAELARRTDVANQKLQQQRGGVKLAEDGSQGTVHAAAVDLQEQVLQEEKSVKLANELRDLAKARSAELLSQLATMDQQVRAAEHQKAAAQEQVKAAQENELSEKARMSMLTKGDQQTATGIFKKLAHGQRIDRKDALFLQEHGLTSGAIQHKVNDRMAEDLDPEFVKWRKAAGGEEALDNAQQHLAESTRDLAQAQKDATKTLQDYMKAVLDAAHGADTAVAAQKKVEATKSNKEGYSNPEMLRPGEKPHSTTSAVELMNAAIQAAHFDFAKALSEIATAVVNSSKRSAAETRRTAQQLNEAHRPS